MSDYEIMLIGGLVIVIILLLSLCGGAACSGDSPFEADK